MWFIAFAAFSEKNSTNTRAFKLIDRNIVGHMTIDPYSPRTFRMSNVVLSRCFTLADFSGTWLMREHCSGGAGHTCLSLLYMHTAREWTSLHGVASTLENSSLPGSKKRKDVPELYLLLGLSVLKIGTKRTCVGSLGYRFQ